jgi:hypothetical protein
MPELAVPLPPRRPELVLSPLGESGRHVLKDPRSGAYFQLGEEEHFLLIPRRWVHSKGGSLMEPRQEKKVAEPRPADSRQERPRRFRLVRLEERFRIIRLEERIAPKVGTHKGCGWTL